MPKDKDVVQPDQMDQPIHPEPQEEISAEEMQDQQAEELPDREAMSLVNANIAAPVNLAAALNVLSDGSIAYANAEQTAPIDQSN